MRKLILMLIGAALTLVACNKAEESVVVGKQGDMFTLMVGANDGIQTRAGEISVLPSISGYTTRYILEIYHSSGDLYERIVQYQNQAGITPNEFNFRLVTNQSYEFLVWVDYAKAETPDADLHYNTASLKSISVMGDYINNDHTRDAFCGNSSVEMYNTSKKFDKITCNRPFGQLNISTTDWNHVKNAAALLPAAVQIKYNGYAEFDVSNGGSATGVPVEFTYKEKQDLIGTATTEGVQALTCDYLFASTTGFNISDTKITFYNQAGSEITNTGSDLATLPIKRNYKTNVSGNLLTKKGKITVDVNAKWENTLTFNLIEDASKLMDAMAAAAADPNKAEVYVFTVKNKIEQGDQQFLIQPPVGLNHAKEIHIIFEENVDRQITIQGSVGGSDFAGKLYIQNSKTAKNFTCNNLRVSGELIMSGNWSKVNSRAKITRIDVQTLVSSLQVTAINNDVELTGREVHILGAVDALTTHTGPDFSFGNGSILLNIYTSQGGSVTRYGSGHDVYFSLNNSF